MGLLSKALKTAVKAADAAKDASRTKPKSQMNPLVKARKKPVETDFDKSASQEVKDFLSAVEEKDPNQLGEFYSPVINTLKEMPIGKQGTKGETISAFLNKRAPNVESSERASFGLKLDPQRKYTREEVIDIAKGDGSEEYTISKINPSDNPMAYIEYKGMQRQNVKDKEEEYFVLTVDSTKYLDASGTKVHFGKPETNLGHTRSSIRIETPAGGPLTKKIKDRERYILVEELQSDVATGYGKLKKANKEGKAPTSPDVESIDNIVDQNIEIALEELEFDVDVGLTIPNSKIINAIKQAHINMHKNNINRFEAGEDLARLLKTEYGINFKGRAEIDAVSKNAIFNSLETADGIKYGRDSLDVDDTIDGLFDDIETEIQASKQQQKAYEQQQKGLPINPPIETRSDYVKKLILANINYAKRNNINKIVVPDYKEIARQRINTFDYAMDQADDSNPTAIKNAEIYNDFENGKITQDEYNIKYNKLAKEYFENLFKKTYEDALKKVLNNLKTETKGAIKIGTRKLEYPAAGNFKGRTSTATEIDITDFDFDPETQALRFNMGGVVPPKNYAEGGVVSMNNQTQQAFALGGLKDEGGEIDEVSGNSVPIGGTKEGVRDDIPANVSEGEFIFPADVVRYHGLDKMMALRQEAKMGLKQMERMGQMGNSDEATIPDDLPFSMADLIVVSGEGKPMEFNEGGFVDLEVADVPMMGDPNTGVNYTRINYDDYMNPPLVMMKEYRNADGESILISFVNGVATTEIPEGYTLYTPPTNTAPTTTQAAIQTVNRRSYNSTASDDGPEPTPTQPAPDYRNMNDNEFFSYMAQQNSFGAKAGNAVATAISLMIPFPGVGMLTQIAMRNHKNNLMNNMKSRIDRMVDGPAKTAALANFKEYGGETDPKKKEGLLTNITNFVNGFVGDVGKLFGISPEEATKAAQQAAVTEVSGTSTAIEATTAQSVTPTANQTRPQLRPDQFPTVQETISNYPKGNFVPDQIASPLGSVLSTEANQGMVPAPAKVGVNPLAARYTAPSTDTMDVMGGMRYNRAEDYQNMAGARMAAYEKAVLAERSAEQIRADAARERSLTMPGGIDPSQSVSKSKIKAGKPVGAATSPDDFEELSAGPETDAGRRIANARGDSFVGGDFQTASLVDTAIPTTAAAQTSSPDEVPESAFTTRRDGPDELSYIDDSTFRDTRNIGASADYNLQQTQTPVEKAQQVAYNAGRTNERVKAAQQAPAVTQQADPRATQQFGNDNYIDPNVVPSNEQSLYTGVSNVVPSNDQSLYTGASGEGYGIGQVDPRLAAAVQTQKALNIPTEPTVQVEGMGSPLSPIAAPKETAAQARAREAAAQQTRIQTRNKEIAAATALIPERIKNSSYYNDQVKRGYTGSTTGGYAVGKISGSDGDSSGVVQKADGKVQKLRDVPGYEGLSGTQRGAMTVYKDEKGTAYVKSTFGKKTKLDGSKYTGSGGSSSGGSGSSASAGRGNTSSGRTVAQIQADINKELDFGRKEFTPKANKLVAEREAAKKAAKSSSSGGGGSSSSSSSTTSSSSSNQSGFGFLRGADESGNTGSSSSKSGYSCYVATALSEKGYWSHTQKIKLIKWCMEAKPEGKLDTILWRNGYCIFGKNIIAPKVDNKIIQWLSNGFYHATISNKKTLQAILGKLFFIIPSYTIGIWKALRGSLVDIERT